MKPLYSQKIDSLQFSQIAEKIVDRYLYNNYLNDANIERRGDCIYGILEEYTLGCVSAYFDLSWVTDFDEDFIDDVVIHISDEGMGSGGNGFGYYYNIVTLDRNKNIKDVHTIFGGGKLSYALLSIDKLENGILYATYEQNPYAYYLEAVTEENKEQLSLEFFIENNQLVEKNYKKCPIAEMNKDIFKTNIDFEVHRETSLDDSYNINQEEKLYMNDKTYYYASISGCEEINLYFSHSIPYDKSLENDKWSIQNAWLEHLQFLIENTRYKTVLSELHSKLSELKSNQIIIEKYGGPTKQFNLKNNWRAILFLSGNEEQGSSITIKLDKIIENEPLSFWKALKRKNNL